MIHDLPELDDFRDDELFERRCWSDDEISRFLFDQTEAAGIRTMFYLPKGDGE